MTTLRSYVDPNRQMSAGPTSFMTERNQHEVRCGMCARPVYVNDRTYRYVNEGMKSGLDNPFLCENCEEQYDDLAYEG